MFSPIEKMSRDAQCVLCFRSKSPTFGVFLELGYGYCQCQNNLQRPEGEERESALR